MLFLGCLDDEVCFFLAVWMTRCAFSWLFGRRGVLCLGCLDAAVCISPRWRRRRRGLHILLLAGSTAAEARTAIFDGEPAVEARRHAFFFWRGPRRRRQGRRIFLLAGSTAAEAVTASLFLTGSSAEEARTAYNLFRQGERILFFGSGTAEVIRQRRRDLRAGRLPLRLFGSDRNDDSQFSSRLALRR